MNRVLVALSAICLPMLSVAAPPITEPVDVNVTNPVLPVEVSNADPIPVSIVTPTYPNQTVCTLRGASATTSDGGFAAVISQSSSMATLLSCPPGVKGVLVRRAVLALYRGVTPGPENVQNVIGVFGFSKEEGADFQELDERNRITGLSFSAPEKSVDTPIPVTPARSLTVNLTCAGIPNYPVRCTSGLLLIGDPIPN